MMSRKRFGYAVAAVVLVAAGVAVPTSANAATGPGGAVITCNVQLDYPHGSGHVGGTISSASRVKCSAPVAEIYNKVTLLNVPRKTQATETDDRSNTAAVQVVAAKACSEGPSTFKASQAVLVKFPAGFTPTPQIDNHSTPNVGVACGNARAVTDASTESQASLDAVDSPSPVQTVSYTITATKG